MAGQARWPVRTEMVGIACSVVVCTACNVCGTGAVILGLGMSNSSACCSIDSFFSD